MKIKNFIDPSCRVAYKAAPWVFIALAITALVCGGLGAGGAGGVLASAPTPLLAICAVGGIFGIVMWLDMYARPKLRPYLGNVLNDFYANED